MLPPSEMVETLRQVPSMIVLRTCIVPPVILKALVLSPFLREQGRPFVSMEKQENLVVLKELIEAGKVTPVIDRTYPLSETPEAIGYVGEGHARGKVVITV
jgi:NADPH:quinone reductase-like Zn-dependent oxidoreductase